MTVKQANGHFKEASKKKKILPVADMEPGHSKLCEKTKNDKSPKSYVCH